MNNSKLRVPCSCGKTIVTKPEYEGRRTQCPSCRKQITLTRLPPVPAEYVPPAEVVAVGGQPDNAEVLAAILAELKKAQAYRWTICGILAVYVGVNMVLVAWAASLGS